MERDLSLLGSIWRYRRMTIAIVSAFALTAALLTFLTSGGPRAEARFGVADFRGGSLLRQGVAFEQGFGAYTAQRAALVRSDAVLGRAREQLSTQGESYELGDLRESVTAEAGEADGVITVAAASRRGEQAALRLADTVVVAYQEVSRAELRRQRDDTLAALDAAREEIVGRLRAPTAEAAGGAEAREADVQALAELNVRVSEVMSDVQMFPEATRFVDAARITGGTGLGELLRGVLIGAGFGLLAAFVAAFVRADFSQRWEGRTGRAGGGEVTPARGERASAGLAG